MHQNCKKSMFIHHVNKHAHKNVIEIIIETLLRFIHVYLGFEIFNYKPQFPLVTKQKKEKEPLERERGLTISTTTNSTSSRMIHIVFLKLCSEILSNQQELPFCVCLGLDLTTLEIVRYYFNQKQQNISISQYEYCKGHQAKATKPMHSAIRIKQYHIL